MSFVPNSGNLFVDPPKLTYLLQLDVGKAKFFVGICGFDPTRPNELADALRQHPVRYPYYVVMHHGHGVMYEVRCSISTPNRRNPCVRTFWLIDAGHTAPRFITSYPYP